MTIAHLSDIHLTENGRIIWGADTMLHFNEAISKLVNQNYIDAIVISGDLSDDGSLWSYDYLDSAFSKLGVPTYCCMGNHDSYDNFPRMKYIKLTNRFFLGGWKFLILNSVIKDESEPGRNKSRGFLDEETINSLSNELKEDIPTAIFLHHPPIEPGGWLNRKILDNRDVFNNLIKGTNVKMVAFGHIHYATSSIMDGIIYTSAPGIGFGFDKDLPKFQIADGTEGFNIIKLEQDNIIIKTVLLNNP